MRFHDMSYRNPTMEVRKGIDRRLCQDRPPEEEIKVRGHPLDLLLGEGYALPLGLPMSWSPEKKSPNCSRTTQIVTGMTSAM